MDKFDLETLTTRNKNYRKVINTSYDDILFKNQGYNTNSFKCVMFLNTILI